MKTREELIEEYCNDDAMLLFLDGDGFDEAIVGVSYRECDPVLVYNADTLVQKLMTGSGMTEDEAIEYAQFNIFDAYFGPQTPIFIEPV